jgi:hypothetical protein
MFKLTVVHMARHDTDSGSCQCNVINIHIAFISARVIICFLEFAILFSKKM